MAYYLVSLMKLKARRFLQCIPRKIRRWSLGLLLVSALFLLSSRVRRMLKLGKGSTQDEINYLASNMEVRYDVLSNLLPIPNGSFPTFLSQITLTNKGSLPIRHGNWAVYFCNIRLVEPEHLKHNPTGYVIPGNYGIKFTHINGCIHKFETTSDFKEIAAGDSFTFKFKADHWSSNIVQFCR
ncbi:uncharacterized protein LOC110048519 [Orbicella faveolata]|uniref:uncharacterized protein LOC110048519 n=1 Tax=Orbicella faveolata TaxID=48498 RepID=UPI0009E5E22D|nr:uncharacterized protein LOC110048519 [Orbicella faveolata]